MLTPSAAEFAKRSLFELERLPRAVLFIDLVESVRLISIAEDSTIRHWLGFLDLLNTKVLPAHDGRMVKKTGDGALMEFSDVASAVQAAFDIQAAIARISETLPTEQQLHLRLGLNIGEVLVDDDDLYGQEVNIAARLMSLAQPGDIVTSAPVREALSSELDAEFEDLGDCYLRNVDQPVRAYHVRKPGENPKIRPQLSQQDLLPTIAVVPFQQKIPGADDFALGEVMAEEIIFALSQSPEINVTSRLSTTKFRMRETGIEEIGAALGAEYILTGNYRGDVKRVVLDAKLAEVKSGRIIWTQRLTEDVANLFSPDSVLNEISASVQNAIIKREVERSKSNPLPTLRSYSLLMSAIALMHRLSPVDFEQARALLETLLERAPRQATPHAWMARWHVLKVQQGWTDDPEKEANLAQDCIARALDADPMNVHALVNEGFVLTNLLKRLDDAEHSYDSALAYSPNDSTGRLLRGTLHAFRGQGPEAMRDTERALHLTPLDPHRFFFYSLASSACIAAENYPRALDLAQQSLRLNRTHTSTLRVKAVAQMRMGQEDEGRRTAGELLRLQPQLTVSKWLETSPSADYPVGREFADTLLKAGIPE